MEPWSLGFMGYALRPYSTWTASRAMFRNKRTRANIGDTDVT